MTKASAHRAWLVLAIAGGVVLMDAALKFTVRALPVPLSVAPGVLIVATRNLRGPFDLTPLGVTIVASIAVLTGLLVLWWRGTLRERVGIGLLLGGGVSNVGERLATGGVTDILTIATGSWNVADAAVIAGCVIVFISAAAGQRRGRSARGESVKKPALCWR